MLFKNLNNMLTESFTSMMVNENESFENTQKKIGFASLLAIFIVIALYLLLLLLVGKYLWNEFGAKYLTIFKPVSSILDILALMVLFNLIFPTCMS